MNALLLTYPPRACVRCRRATQDERLCAQCHADDEATTRASARALTWALTRTGERVRGFQVIVARPEKKTNLRYPVVTGREALQLMELMAKRGRETIAETESFGVVEDVTLDEMRDMEPYLR